MVAAQAPAAANDDSAVISDDYLRRLIDNYIRAAKLAQRAGFQFVDVKHCHGYLGHEMLSAFTRPGPYGGSFENRTRFLRGPHITALIEDWWTDKGHTPPPPAPPAQRRRAA